MGLDAWIDKSCFSVYLLISMISTCKHAQCALVYYSGISVAIPLGKCTSYVCISVCNGNVWGLSVDPPPPLHAILVSTLAWQMSHHTVMSYVKRFSCEIAEWQLDRQTHRRNQFYTLNRWCGREKVLEHAWSAQKALSNIFFQYQKTLDVILQKCGGRSMWQVYLHPCFMDINGFVLFINVINDHWHIYLQFIEFNGYFG